MSYTSTIRSRLLKMVKDHPDWDYARLADELNTSRQSVQASLSRLRALGLTTHTARKTARGPQERSQEAIQLAAGRKSQSEEKAAPEPRAARKKKIVRPPEMSGSGRRPSSGYVRLM